MRARAGGGGVVQVSYMYYKIYMYNKFSTCTTGTPVAVFAAFCQARAGGIEQWAGVDRTVVKRKGPISL